MSDNPWIVRLRILNSTELKSAVLNRLTANSSLELQPLIERFNDYIPVEIRDFCGIGFVRCEKPRLKQENDGWMSRRVYLAEPLPEIEIKKRVSFFKAELRSLMAEFLSKFAGCGEEMEGVSAGQFALRYDRTAEEVAYYEPEQLGTFRTAKLLYHAANGDSVFIDNEGRTAWYVLETGELVTLFESMAEFIRHYADFQATNRVFDSWESRSARRTL